MLGDQYYNVKSNIHNKNPQTKTSFIRIKVTGLTCPKGRQLANIELASCRP